MFKSLSAMVGIAVDDDGNVDYIKGTTTLDAFAYLSLTLDVCTHKGSLVRTLKESRCATLAPATLVQITGWLGAGADPDERTLWVSAAGCQAILRND